MPQGRNATTKNIEWGKGNAVYMMKRDNYEGWRLVAVVKREGSPSKPPPSSGWPCGGAWWGLEAGCRWVGDQIEESRKIGGRCVGEQTIEMVGMHTTHYTTKILFIFKKNLEKKTKQKKSKQKKGKIFFSSYHTTSVNMTHSNVWLE